MTILEIIQMVERNMVKHLNPMIDTETDVKVVKQCVVLAKKKNIDWAVVGGIAMHFYGSPRLTNDVDVTASAILPLEAERQLGFGSACYRVRVGRKQIALDWIVRDDQAKKFYEKALTEAYLMANGLLTVTLEWLVILKYIAGRFKDQQDAVFYLSRKA